MLFYQSLTLAQAQIGKCAHHRGIIGVVKLSLRKMLIFKQKLFTRLLFIAGLVSVIACSEVSEADPGLTTLRHSEQFELEVYKSASCGCCGKWITHMNENGFQTKTHNSDDLSSLKSSMGVKPNYRSCHTAISKEGFVFEGHVPARYIQQFLDEKPAGAIGLTAPGMPMSSPGMDVGDTFMPYEVIVLYADGSAKIYARVNSLEEQY